MDVPSILPAFVVAVLVISASPGPAMALILRRAALRGARSTVATILGLEAGLFVWALAAGAGLAGVVAASQVAYTVLRVVGAAVLITLGVQAWRSAWRGVADPDEGRSRTQAGGSARRAFLEGFLVQAANPKAAIFMFAFYPQFVPSDGRVLAWTAALASMQVALELVLYLGLAVGVGRASAWFRRPVVHRRMELASGTVLVALGARVAAASR